MQEFVKLCMEQAREAFFKGEVPVGCVVTRDGRVVAVAHNRVEALKDPTAHAEIIALKEAMQALDEKHLYGCEVYVSLEPCPMCAYAMVLARIEKVLFLAGDEKCGAVMSRFNLLDDPAFNHRVKWEYLPLEEAGDILRKFFSLRRI
ncbi:MAG: nucleoside deaminase [Aquificaceae bacterium]|nr:nucleoside deaminase [Aquificaceae bacterium]MCX8164589.1 nucleoside deaminase [Aquificaceae bacterium]